MGQTAEIKKNTIQEKAGHAWRVKTKTNKQETD